MTGFFVRFFQKYVVDYDDFPKDNSLKKYCHNLKYLFLKITSELRPTDNFLDENELYLPILDFLSDFAMSTRYYNLNSLIGDSKNNDPLHEWHKIQSLIKSKYCKIRFNKKDNYIIKALDSHALIRFRDESDNPVITGTAYYSEGKITEKVQGYSVLLVYRIIDYLILILIECSSRKSMLPYYGDFFPLFQNEYMTDAKVRKKKDWTTI